MRTAMNRNETNDLHFLNNITVLKIWIDSS
jgi:hypothetical protein